MASRSLNDLDPRLRPLADDLARRFEEATDCALLIYCTFRSPFEQGVLYAQGRSRPGEIVTFARPGESAHNITDPDGRPAARAFDAVPLVHGKPAWDPDNPLWIRYGTLAESLGLEWAGRWPKGKREFPHVQLPATIKEAA